MFDADLSGGFWKVAVIFGQQVRDEAYAKKFHFDECVTYIPYIRSSVIYLLCLLYLLATLKFIHATKRF